MTGKKAVLFLMLSTPLIALINGCQELKEILIPPPMHYGLNKNSYGAKTKLFDARRSKFYINDCDPSLQQQSNLLDFTQENINLFFSYLTLKNNVDDTIKKLNLTEYFNMPVDLSGNPTVAIIDPDPKNKSINFWHLVTAAPLAEVIKAADAYCKNENRKAIYMGTARKCEMQQIKVKDKKTKQIKPLNIYSTFAISEFKCL